MIMIDQQLALFDTITAPHEKRVSTAVINVASVPQRSPFRYPGGKTWAVPIIRKWLGQAQSGVPLLVEPFCGGGIASLTAVAEGLVQRAEMIELDHEVAAVWKTITGPDNSWLLQRILSFDLTPENIKAELDRATKTLRETAFCTILKNRVNHGGIITKGAGMLRVGENGRGIASRWYPTTLANRIETIGLHSHRLTTIEGDGFDGISRHSINPANYFFIDPPYVGAGRRLYTHYDIDHERLLKVTSEIRGHFLLTYDDNDSIRGLADRFGLKYTTVPMKTTHHLEKRELLISDNFDWL